jgi:hypothetical protein
LTLPQIGAVCLLSLLAVLLIGLAVGPNLADASKRKRNCVEILGNNSYSCRFRLQGGGITNGSLQFFPDNEDHLFVDGLHSGLCQCGAAGSFEKPQFGASNEFFCLINEPDGGSNILTGRAEFYSIRDGQFLPVNSSLSAAVFWCIKDSKPE